MRLESSNIFEENTLSLPSELNRTHRRLFQFFPLSRALESPWAVFAAQELSGVSPSLLLGGEQLPGGCCARSSEKDTRSTTAYHALTDVTSCLSLAFQEN